jgi:cytochrome c oxidase cbb3-type subunit 3
MRVSVAFAIGIVALTGCQREKRDLRPAPVRVALYENAARESALEPGGPKPEPSVSNPYHGTAYDISEGQRLFGWYNCSGCHANGGGGMGPPLVKKVWLYGGEPANLFDTIVKGRPNGMPTWGGRIPEYQIWQLVAYVKSINQEEPTSATAPRADTLETGSQNLKNKVPGVTK